MTKASSEKPGRGVCEAKSANALAVRGGEAREGRLCTWSLKDLYLSASPCSAPRSCPEVHLSCDQPHPGQPPRLGPALPGLQGMQSPSVLPSRTEQGLSEAEQSGRSPSPRVPPLGAAAAGFSPPDI